MTYDGRKTPVQLNIDYNTLSELHSAPMKVEGMCCN